MSKKEYIVLRTALVLMSLGVLLLTRSYPSYAQQGEAINPLLDIPLFHLDALSFASDQPSKSRLEVFIQLPYEMLSFTKIGDVFHSSYELSFDMFDSTGTLVEEKLSTENIDTKNYNESISKNSGKTTQKSFILPPGRYNLTVQVRDQETQKTSRLQRSVFLREFKSTFGMSDLMLVNSLKTPKAKGHHFYRTFATQAFSRPGECDSTR